MRTTSSIIVFLLLLLTATATAQERDRNLTIQVSSVAGDNLSGQKVTLYQTDYEVSYGTLTLDANGQCTLKAYAGNHSLSVDREGFESLSYDFTISEDESEKVVAVTLHEKTRTPFALTTSMRHDVFSGKNSIDVSWNIEAPAFFDDFESYDPFAIQFGEWTGIDADLEAAAPLVGNYPNRGVMQYAQIINPLTVEPTWWYDYPILRPYSGQQYAGFTRTSSGNANDDWLISPVITVGTDNVLTFMGKAADRYPERFMVYVTTKTDGPVQSDFVRLDQGNYETADYRGWQQYSYNLSAYAGQQVRFAIRYISDYNRYGSFMLMVDDVFVGQQQTPDKAPKARRIAASPANPNETFRIYLDGVLVGTTSDYSYTLEDVPAGNHTIGIQAVYLQAESTTATVNAVVPAADSYAHITFLVTADSQLTADGQQLALTSMETSEAYELTVTDGKVEFPYLPKGEYVVNIAEGAFSQYLQHITVSGDASITVTLNDNVITPYNITASMSVPEGSATGEAVYTLRWNQELMFTDSFEEYDDFATGSFGKWKTVDRDRLPVYPIALGSTTNIISFPGSGTATNPTAIAPMVFNPWHTSPAMLPTDPAIKAPTGDKSVIFFSAQSAKNDKWLISPLFDIQEGFVLNVTAKGYTDMYPESVEFCVSEDGDQPDDFVAVSKVDQLSSEQWTIYQTDLADYAGKQIRLAVHYTSFDAFLAQVDDFSVGPENGQGQLVDYGNVVRFDISLDGQKIGETTTPVFTLPVLSTGIHTIGIKAVYRNSVSEEAFYTIDTTTGLTLLHTGNSRDTEVYSLSGQYLGTSTASLPSGMWIVKQNGITRIIRK